MDLLTSAFESTEATSYEVIKKFENDIEERFYPNQNWITCEKVANKDSLDNYKDNFLNTLIGYFKNQNFNDQKLPMTTPVVTRVEILENNYEYYRMSMHIPKEFQEKPPRPTNSTVKIMSRDLHIYSISFGGFAKQVDYSKKYQELIDFLKGKNVTCVTAGSTTKEPVHFFVSYDNSPLKLWNRKNEVWIQVV